MKPFKIVTLVAATAMFFTASAIAKPNLPAPVADAVKVEKLAGSAGPFEIKETFPQGYFLIPRNLPFLVGLALFHPESSKLELSQEQLDALVKLKKDITPTVLDTALKVKKLELEIVEGMTLKHDDVDAKVFYDRVDQIAKLKSDLTKAHLICIQNVKSILTADQYETLLDYGVVNMF